MRDVLEELLEWWQQGETVGVGTVVATWRSAPRPAGASMLVESSGSCPASTSCSSAASATVRAHGPAWSSEEASATRPYRDTPPYVGLAPTVPVTAAGWRIEPPVSVPMASGAW